jgi:orotate phosphoribosyltransferase
VLAQIFAMAAFRTWFYGRARQGTGEAFRGIAKPGQKIMVIGDALKAGKSRPAIASAFEAALLS